MKTLGRRIGALGVIAVMLGSVTSCTSVFSLPHEQRYQYINNVLDEVDYQTIGTILEEQIDDGDGVFEPSYKKVYYKEIDAYSTLVERIGKLPNASCSGGVEVGRFDCTRGQVSIGVALLEEDHRGTYFGMTDSSGGR